MAQTKLPSIDDLFRLRFLSDPQISPDGRTVAFVERRIDPRRDEYVSHLCVVPFEGGKVRRLTRGPVRDAWPRWSPDGKTLLFVREMDEQRQIVLTQPHVPRKKRKEKVLLDARGVPAKPCWSPDGERIAFLFRPLTWEEREARRPADRRRPRPRVIRRLLHREDGRGFLPDDRNHVWVMNRRGKDLQQLTDGPWEDREPLWDPDGSRVLFLSNRIERADYLFGNMDIWSVAAEGGEPVRLTLEEGPLGGPAFSPDGRRIAFLGNLDPIGGIWRNFGPRAIPAEGGPSVALAPSFDRTCLDTIIHDLADFGFSPRAPVWSPDGSELFFIASDRGASNLYRLSAAGGEPEPVVAGTQDLAAYSASRDGRRWALLIGDPGSPHEVFVWQPESDDPPRPLTAANQKLLGRRRLAVPEEVEITVPDGDGAVRPLHGWVLRPPGASGGDRHPLILAIHGGPMAMYGWIYVHALQVLAASGFSVLYTNPRGSQGYGEAYCTVIRGDWGNLDYRDLMAAADWASRQPYVDAGRMGVTGGSYGGFMTNWIVGHTDRFRAAIADASISNLHSLHGTTDFGWDFAWELGARPWEDPARFLRQSPLSYVESIRTPLLLIHSEMDLRCSVDQADQLFTALKVLEREVEYVRYPEQSHGMARGGRPSLRKDRLERYVEWFTRYLEAEAETTADERPEKEPEPARLSGATRGRKGRHSTRPG